MKLEELLVSLENLRIEFNRHTIMNMIKKSDIIKTQIDKLEVEYEKAIQDESRFLLWDDRIRKPKDVGYSFFNITKAEVILGALHKGRQLFFEHSLAYGNYLVKMNPQQNRIIVYREDGRDDGRIDENTIMNFIIGTSGSWYILND